MDRRRVTVEEKASNSTEMEKSALIIYQTAFNKFNYFFEHDNN